VLVTAGPTAEPLDPVRVITNRSSGRQGYAIAQSLSRLGAQVTLVSGPTALDAPAGVERVNVETAEQMLAACLKVAGEGQPLAAGIFVAAVADWRPDEAFAVKLKKSKAGPPTIALAETKDILATIAETGPRRPKLVVGFAAETDHVEEHAKAKLARKGCDWIVANDVSEPGVMGGADNTVLLISKAGVERWEKASKEAVAARIAARVAEALA
jgi:phosphopantothenoylcysteine decarboxylase/phosphopantothenate--cysteine ligase